MPQYIYKLIREDWTTGTRAKRPRIIIRDKPDLQVGGLFKMLSHERQIKRKRRKVVPHFTIQDELIKITIKNS